MYTRKAELTPPVSTLKSEISISEDAVNVKTCTKCGIEFPATLEYFTKKQHGKYGLRSRCRKCESKNSSDYNAAHREERRAYDKKYNIEHHDERLAKQRIYCYNHREEIRARKRKYAPYHIKYNIEHREEHAVYRASYYKKNRENILSRIRVYNNSHRGRTVHKLSINRRRARIRLLPFDFSPSDWQHCLNYWHGRCAYCGKQAEGLWVTVHQEHFIPIADTENCPGTVRWNMLPACGGCNFSKGDSPAREWLERKFGIRYAEKTLAAIFVYFQSVI
jgi:hypothetical protein